MAEHLPHRTFDKPVQPDFTEMYEHVTVPTFQSYSDVQDAQLQGRIDHFFASIIEPLQLNAFLQEEIVVYEEKVELETIQRSLSLKDFQVLATVLSTKQADAYATVAEKKSLSPATVVAIRGYHEGDDLLTDILFRRLR